MAKVYCEPGIRLPRQTLQIPLPLTPCVVITATATTIAVPATITATAAIAAGAENGARALCFFLRPVDTLFSCMRAL